MTQDSRATIIMMSAAYISLQLSLVGGWAFSDWCFTKYASQIKAHITEMLLKRASKFPYSFFQDNPQGSIMAKINEIANLIPYINTMIIYQFTQFILTVLITLVILATIHIMLALILGLWISIFLYRSFFSLKKVNRLTAEHTEVRARASGYVADYFANILNVLCFSRQKFEAIKLKNINAETIKKCQAQQFFTMKFYVYQGITVTIYCTGFLSVIFYFNSLKMMTPGNFALILMLNIKVIDRLFELSHQLRDFVPNFGALKQSYKIFEQTIEIEDKPGVPAIHINKGEIF